MTLAAICRSPSLSISGDIEMQDGAKSRLLPAGERAGKAITPSQAGRSVAYNLNTGAFVCFLTSL